LRRQAGRDAREGRPVPLVTASIIIPPPSEGSQYARLEDYHQFDQATQGDNTPSQPTAFAQPHVRHATGGGGRGGGYKSNNRGPGDNSEEPGDARRRSMRKAIINTLASLMLHSLKYFVFLWAVFTVTKFFFAVLRTVHNTVMHVGGRPISSSEVLTGAAQYSGTDGVPPRTNPVQWFNVAAIWVAMLAAPMFFSKLTSSKQ
jgi:hypothetical protein